MPSLIYTAITSVDGFVEDADGGFEWAEPDDEVHSFINELERPAVTHLYGRRMYETMVYWENVTVDPTTSRASADFAKIWRAADKVVYSSSLEDVTSSRTRLERSFDPEAVREMKDRSLGPLSIGGATLAARAIADGLVDEIRLVIQPVAVGAGRPALRVRELEHLELVDRRTFACGAVYLAYRLRRGEP